MIITEKSLCKILNLSRTTLYRRRKAGMPFLGGGKGKAIRYEHKKVLDWMEKKGRINYEG